MTCANKWLGNHLKRCPFVGPITGKSKNIHFKGMTLLLPVHPKIAPHVLVSERFEWALLPHNSTHTNVSIHGFAHRDAAGLLNKMLGLDWFKWAPL
mmetsp:Transcript_24053/g.39532  ORF Transcript_24053/g.39532 Transcript_24053/m.39532 type:complete len:96 (+) Transcript_24053:90-377(+)